MQRFAIGKRDRGELTCEQTLGILPQVFRRKEWFPQSASDGGKTLPHPRTSHTLAVRTVPGVWGGGGERIEQGRGREDRAGEGNGVKEEREDKGRKRSSIKQERQLVHCRRDGGLPS